MAAYQLPPPPSAEEPLVDGWLFELYKRNQSLIDLDGTFTLTGDVTGTTAMSPITSLPTIINLPNVTIIDGGQANTNYAAQDQGPYGVGTGGLFSEDSDGNIVGGTGAGANLVGASALENFLAGQDAGSAITTGDYNVAVGFQALKNAVEGSNNVCIGPETGHAIIDNYDNVIIGGFSAINGDLGGSNVFIGGLIAALGTLTFEAAGCVAIGDEALGRLETGTESTVVGWKSGRKITSGQWNSFLGSRSGGAVTTGEANVAIGFKALYDFNASATGDDNIAIGQLAMASAVITSANNNIAIGASSLIIVTTAVDNIAIGDGAGVKIVAGINNVMIGKAAGPTTNQSNKLFIHNAESDTPLIGGDFSAGTVDIEGTLTLQGVFLPKLATDAALNAIANAINTAASKVQGAMVYNTSTDNPVYAVGNTDGAIWVDGSGATANTPV